MLPETSAALYDSVTISPLSLGQIALILVLILPLAGLIGFRTGARRRRALNANGDEIDKVVGQTTLNAFLALLGLLLAFTFSNSLAVSESMKRAITDEASALGTAFLRADYVAEPGRAELRTALLDYARTRIVPDGHAIDTPAKARAFIETTLAAQARVWPATLAATADPTPAPIATFVAGAVNAALDAHLYRMATLSVPISAYTQLMVLVAAAIAMFLLANRTGMLGRTLTWRTFAFALFLAGIMYVIVDVRRGNEGLIRADDSTLRATIFDMEQALGQPG